MNDLRLAFFLELPDEAPPDLSSISVPVRIAVRLLPDRLPSKQPDSRGPRVATEDTNA
jgi:hypothetical protein